MFNLPKTTAMLIVGLCFLVALSARADTLSGQTVSRFIASMEKLRASENFSEHFMSAWEAGREGRDYPGSLMPSETVALMEGREGEETFKAIIGNHGFDGPETWGRAGDRALLALMSLQVGNNTPAIQKQLVQMQHEVGANPQFSDAQKQRMQQIIDSTSQILERVAAVPEADREAVQPHLKELQQALDYQSGY